jgi:hypothetical protein
MPNDKKQGNMNEDRPTRGKRKGTSQNDQGSGSGGGRGRGR